MNNILPSPPDLNKCSDIKSTLITRFKHEDEIHKIIFEEFNKNRIEHNEFYENININSKYRRVLSKVLRTSIMFALVILLINAIYAAFS